MAGSGDCHYNNGILSACTLWVLHIDNFSTMAGASMQIAKENYAPPL